MLRRRWTEQDKRLILELVSADGPDRHRVAAAVGADYHQLDNYITRHIRPAWDAAAEAYYARARAQAEIAPPTDRAPDLTAPVRPFEVPIAPGAIPAPGKPLTAVIYGDVHYPFQDNGAVACVLGVIKDLQPDVVVCVGDLVDCWQISRFDKDPARHDTLQDSIDLARIHLHQVAQVAPNADRILLEGNHEARFRKVIWRAEGGEREVMKLRKTKATLNWPYQLELDAIGWRFFEERDQSKAGILPKVITKHGTQLRKWSAWSAKAEWEKYGRSGFSGHTHRLGIFRHRDANGIATWTETGCLCLLDPPYGSDFDWAQGFAVASWNADRRLMDVQLPSIRDGAVLWQGREFVAPEAVRAAA